MGVSSNSTCSNITREQYVNLKSKAWSNSQSYLYQADVEHIRQDKIIVMTYELNINLEEYEAYFQKLNMMSKYLNRGNIQLPLLCMTQSKDQCSCGQESKSKVMIYYQNYNIELSHEIRTRKRLNEKFREEQLWFIMYGCINAVRQFEPFAQASGNISLQEVIMNRKGEIKLNVALSSPFQKTRQSLQDNYFAPEELQLMRKIHGFEGSLSRKIYKEHNINPNICQVFSIGILLLILATQASSSILYIPPYKFNSKALTLQLQKLPKLGYSRLFCNLIKIMLSPYQTRPLPSQIRSTFKQFQFEIIHLKPFNYSLNGSQQNYSR